MPLTTMLTASALIGLSAGVRMRPRRSLLLAPPGSFEAFERTLLGAEGPSGDGRLPASALGRGVHGRLAPVPMLVRATVRAGVARRTSLGPLARHGASRVALYARRGVAAVAGLALLVLAALIARPAGPDPYLDENGDRLEGSISEKIKVNIGGLEQGMFIKGKNVGNPVLLYLHGGIPDYFLTERYPTGLDEDFTVVWWEQRGSGLSYSADVPPESVNPEQLVSDTMELTNYLRERFGQRKIYLMGRSGGTFIGIQAAARAPELYHAYLGVAQISNQLESERLAHDYMLQRYKDDGNTAMVRRLEAGPVGDAAPLPNPYMKVRDVAMHELGVGTTHDMKSIFTGLFLRSLRNREYTLREKIGIWRGKIFSGRRLWNTQLSTDLTKKVTRLEMPVYFFHGIYDYTVSYPLAKSYYERLDAPVKGFYTFNQSAHSPHFEEPGKMNEILRADVLTGSKGLADPE